MVSFVTTLKLILKFLCLSRFSQHNSLADVTRDRYGEEVLATFRTYERTSIKRAKLEQDLDFLKKCQDANLFPVFLRFKLSNSRLQNSKAVAKCRRRLLANEIKAKVRELQRVEERLSCVKSDLLAAVRWIDFIHYESVVLKTVEKETEETKRRQFRKFLGLRTEAKSMNGLLDPDSVITNLSDYVLSDVEKMALARGLDYTLPPTQLKKGGYLANFELLFGRLENKSFFGDNDEKLYFQNKLRNLAFSSLYNFNSSRHNLLNLPKEEMTALKQLSKNKDIIIFKPDKGTGIVIMNATDYIAKIEQIILDETKFSKHQNQDLYKISRSVERKVRNYLRDHLKKTGLISTETYRQLYPNGSRIGLLYGNPKVHKQGCPIRPICSAVGTATYDLSKYLAEIISPAATNSYGTDCRDSFQFLEQLQNYDLNNYFMACFDVSSLFTNVPLDETIGITLDRLYRSDVNTPPNLPEHVLKHLLEMCVKDNVFVFNGQVFYQTDGVAMGNPLGPILANIFMAHLEESMIFCGPNIVQPTFYRRYVDDTFCLFTTKEEAERFLVFINNLHPNIRFEMETESDGKLEFLDTVVERRPDSTSHRTSTKVKQTDKGIYYHYSSFIPDSYKLNKIFTLVYRAYRIASDMSVFHVDVEKLKKRLRLNGFPTYLIDQVTSKVLMRYHAQQDNQQDTQQPDRERVYIALPYLGPVSIILKRQLTKLVQKFYPSVQLKVVFRRGFRISNLFNYKDKFPIACRSMIVYYIQCKKCGPSQAYIGKTINSLYERFHASGTGHLHPNNIESALLKHCVESNDPECAFHFDDVKILESGRFDEEIRFIESILLKYDRQNLNTCERSIELKVV